MAENQVSVYLTVKKSAPGHLKGNLKFKGDKITPQTQPLWSLTADLKKKKSNYCWRHGGSGITGGDCLFCHNHRIQLNQTCKSRQKLQENSPTSTSTDYDYVDGERNVANH